MDSKMLSIQEVAERLDVHHYTVRRLIWRGDLKASKVGRQWRISEEDLRQFLDVSGHEGA